MKEAVFITGNRKKADYFSKYLGHPIECVKLDLDEIQSLDLKEVVRHKMLQAHKQVQKPVLVEDVALECKALGKLPGTFVRWFLEELTLQHLCSLLDGKDRSATARCMFGYYDGKEERYFEGALQGTIPEKPAGSGGYGWDPIFIPQGYGETRAELSEEDYQRTYLQLKPFDQVKEFLLS
jgi:non-canonical purine NTP pyrophosphatase (RdgB/HAM1 family)